jgi:glutathione S-transferase
LEPFSGESVHFQFAAPDGLDYAKNRYRREAERHYQVLNDHLTCSEYIVGKTYTIADVSAWGWLDRASRVRKGADDPLSPSPHLKRLSQTIDAGPAAGRARASDWTSLRDEMGQAGYERVREVISRLNSESVAASTLFEIEFAR